MAAARGPGFGLALAGFGTLVLTPDALFMRLSGMDGLPMTAWRGLFMGAVMLAAWALAARDRGGDLRRLVSGTGLMIVGCQFLNTLLFCLGIAVAPVTVVLLGLATVPVCAALLSRVLLNEPTAPATWAAIAAVLAGIGLAISGGAEGAWVLEWRAALGAALGLGVSVVVALNFVVLRARPQLPILLLVGAGALLAGIFGVALSGPAAMMAGQVWAMAATGMVVLPVAFFTLSLAARHTHAANVSLLMLMETVLGPLWVWLGVGEAPTPRMVAGGVIVVGSLAVYLVVIRRCAPRRAQ